MDWLTQNWIWVALGIGAFFMISWRGFGQYAGGHVGHGRVGSCGTGENGFRPTEPASERERAGTAAATDSTTIGTGASTTPAQGAPQARRRHGCC